MIEYLKKARPPQIRNEDELELFFLGYLQGTFLNEKIEIIPQNIISRGKQSQPDIVVGGTVAIELKYIRSLKDANEGVGQASSYASIYPHVVLYYYDPRRKGRYERVLYHMKTLN